MKGVSGKRWVLLSEQTEPPPQLVERFGHIIAQLLTNRNFTKQADLIFNVKLKNLIPYDSIPNIEYAAERIKRAIKKGERIVIYGDYDVDGITSTAILYDFLRRSGAKIVPVLPSRNMGYGLNKKITDLISKYADLLITVDNGTSAVEEINSMDIDVIVIDHHNPQDILPDAIIASLRNELDVEIDIRSYIDLVALGTVADVMPLNYLNRIFVVKGVEFFNRILEGYEGKAGIRALLRVSNLGKVSFRDVGFRLAPRLNSAGRIGDPRLSLQLLLEEREERALYYARKLEMLNIYRRRLSDSILKEACTMTEGDIYSVVSEIEHMFLKWGGHSGAVGVTLPVERFDEFREYVDGKLRDKEKVLGVLEIDMRLDPHLLTGKHGDMIKCLQPFGEGNAVPTFMMSLEDKNVERIYIVYTYDGDFFEIIDASLL